MSSAVTEFFVYYLATVMSLKRVVKKTITLSYITIHTFLNNIKLQKLSQTSIIFASLYIVAHQEKQ